VVEMTARDFLVSDAVPVVTAADMVAGHVTLDISCLDRIYLTGFVPGLQTAGGVVYFLHNHPLTALDRPNAPPELAHALATIDRIVNQRILEARVPTTASRSNPDITRHCYCP
jgi:hypothetical protein